MDAPLDMNTRRIINVGEAVNAGDVVNKKYVDDKVGNIKALETALQQEVQDRKDADESLSDRIGNIKAATFRVWSN